MEAEGNVQKNTGKVQNKMGDIESKVAPSSGASDKVSGTFHEAKGGLKEGFGKAIGNDKMRAEGFLEKNAGKVEQKEGDIKRTIGQ